MSYAGVDRNANAFAVREDGQGREIISLWNDTGATISANAMKRITWLKVANKNGRIAAIANSTTTSDRQIMVVAVNDHADQTWCDYYLSGPNIVMTIVSGTYTAGDGLVVDNSDGKVINKSGPVDLTDQGFFASIEVGGTTVTSVTVFLLGRESVVQA